MKREHSEHNLELKLELKTVKLSASKPIKVEVTSYILIFKVLETKITTTNKIFDIEETVVIVKRVNNLIRIAIGFLGLLDSWCQLLTGSFDSCRCNISRRSRSASVINFDDVFMPGQVADVFLRRIARAYSQRTKGRVRNVSGWHSELDEAVPSQCFGHLVVRC